MSTVFISRVIWPQLTKAVRNSRQPCFVAVAYFGAGAGRLLPLPKNSRLVVDASERAVASGQTCPADLIKLVKRGVKAYSVSNLHAKVFVLGRVAYIGSANVSSRSAAHLVEAVVRTTESDVLRDARQFVREHCLHELTPKVLKHLAKLYRPPRALSEMRRKGTVKDSSHRPSLPRLLLAQLYLASWSEREQMLYDTGLPTARKRREHSRSHQIESFIIAGRCAYQKGDVVIMVTDEGSGKVLVSPPGNVLHTQKGRGGSANMTSVYVECRSRRRRQLKGLALCLGRGSLKRLRRNGIVRDAAFAQALFSAWGG